MSTSENSPGGSTRPEGTGWPTREAPAPEAPEAATGSGPPPEAPRPDAAGPIAGGPIAGGTAPPGAAPQAAEPPGAAPPAPLPPAPRSGPPPASSWPAAPVGRRGTGTYPIDIGVDVPERIARWRPILQWILAIPLYILLYVLRIVAGICAFIGWFAALFTAELPDGLANLIAGYYRLYWRTTSYSLFLREKYPSFSLAMGYADPADDPAWLDVQRPAKLSRLAVLFRVVLIIPQLIAILFLQIALSFALFVAFFAVTILGRWPDGLREFVVGANRWTIRVDAWFWLLADPYPPFSLT